MSLEPRATNHEVLTFDHVMNYLFAIHKYNSSHNKRDLYFLELDEYDLIHIERDCMR